MKKIVISLLILTTATTAFIGCSKKDNSNKNENNTPVISEEDTDVEEAEENTNEETSDNDSSDDLVENNDSSIGNNYDEVEMEEIQGVTSEQVAEYAQQLGQRYYDYEIDLDVIKVVDGINLYRFAIHSGPPNNTVKEYMLGADGVLYNYESALNGILKIEE